MSVAALLALTACQGPSAVPVAETFPTVHQQIVESAADWQMITADMWGEVTASLEAGGYHVATIGLESPAQKTQFTAALDDFLFTQAVSHGVAVSPGCALHPDLWRPDPALCAPAGNARIIRPAG